MEQTAEQIMKEALEAIAKPIVYLQKEAEKEGGQLNGMEAIALSNNANWLSSIASRALFEIANIQKQVPDKQDEEHGKI